MISAVRRKEEPVGKLAVEPVVLVNGAVDPVLPSIDHEHSRGVLQRRRQEPIDDFGDVHLPRSVRGSPPAKSGLQQRRTLPSGKYLCHSRRGGLHALRKTFGVQPQNEQKPWDHLSASLDQLRPALDIIFFTADVAVRFDPGQGDAHGYLQPVLHEDIADHVVHGHTVLLQELGGGVQLVLGKVTPFIAVMEEERVRPVGNDG